MARGSFRDDAASRVWRCGAVTIFESLVLSCLFGCWGGTDGRDTRPSLAMSSPCWSCHTVRVPLESRTVMRAVLGIMIEEKEENKSNLKKNCAADETAPARGQVRRDEARGLAGKKSRRRSSCSSSSPPPPPSRCVRPSRAR